MADNIYEHLFCFVDSSIIICNYFINYYIIASCWSEVSSMSKTKINTRTPICFVDNAQLFDSSESNEILPMSNTAVNIAAAFHIFFQIIGHAN